MPTARDFYATKLGFDVTPTLGDQVVFVSAGGYHHHMAMNVWNSRGAGLRPTTVPPQRSTMATGTDTLTTEDLEFLARPLHGFLTVAGAPQPAQPRPVWFEATADGTVQLFTPSDSVKLRRLRRDPRASIVVADPIGERERWVSVTARTTVEGDGARDLAVRLAARYWDLDERADDLAAMIAEENVRVVLHPERVRRFAF